MELILQKRGEKTVGVFNYYVLTVYECFIQCMIKYYLKHLCVIALKIALLTKPQHKMYPWPQANVNLVSLSTPKGLKNLMQKRFQDFKCSNIYFCKLRINGNSVGMLRSYDYQKDMLIKSYGASAALLSHMATRLPISYGGKNMKTVRKKALQLPYF